MVATLGGMLARLSARLADLAQRVVPDPFVIALGLTVVAFGLGLVLMPEADPSALATGWLARATHPGTLAFTTQMALVLIAGATLARAPTIARLLGALASIPRTTASAAALTAFVAMATGLVNWGFGLVVGAVLAREIGDRAAAAGRRVDRALVGAAGYTCMLTWHGGFSGSAPLKVTESTPAVGGATVAGPGIPLDATVLSALNVGLTALMLVFIPLLFVAMAKGADARAPVAEPAPRPALDADPERHPLAGRLLALAIVAFGGLALAGRMGGADVWYRALDLNGVILLVLLGGLLLFGTPVRYGRAFGASVPEAGGILLQFPFYFGILGVLEAAGMVKLLAHSSADAARGLEALGLPLQFAFDAVTFLSAGLVNLFVPSGGGQWAVQGSILAQAAHDLGLPLERAVMALSYGDEWTNMAQPFWALALLGITGLKARDILGYALLVLLAALPIYLVAFLLW